MARNLRPRIAPESQRTTQRDPYSDGTPGENIPLLDSGLLFRDQGSSGLRQWGGWVREEFLRALQGREAARVYREMYDNSPVVSAMIFAITQSMRKINWRVEPADDTPDALEAADFADSIRGDMLHTWDEMIVEALSMLHFGFAPLEIVYKKRLGEESGVERVNDPIGAKWKDGSKYDDGLIGIARLPLRGQETILKWFFDINGQVLGLQQQPWMGGLLNLPIEKLLLFRASHFKNNPEGRSILRSSYRAYFFIKRIEEQEAIMFERLSGLPLLKVPNALLEAANSGNSTAMAALTALKKIITNVRVDEQMGILLPSDTWAGPNGPSNIPMYEFELVTPKSTSLHVSSDIMIKRYNLDILKTVLADFIDLGHQARGTQNLAINKVDMFYQAIEGWLNSMASVFNRYLLPRVWALNALDRDLMPRYVPDLAQRVDLDVLSNFILRLAQSGARMFPDTDLENFLRDSAGLPEINEDEKDDGPAEPDVKVSGSVVAHDGEGNADRSTTSPTASPKAVATSKWLADQLSKQIKKEAKPYRVRNKVTA